MKHLHIVLLILLTCCTGNLRAQPAQLVNAFPALTFSQPVFLTHSGDSTDRIWVVQQDGIIAVFPNDSTAASTSTFLDISEKLSSPAGEEGLLGLAFHPRYAANGYFYVNYTAPNPLRTVIARYSVLPNDPNKADSLSEVVILEIAQPYGNHNGGMIMFGADGCLYIATGDGGSGGDPHDNGQNKAALLGKILRINVDTTTATTLYGIPPDNPFAGNTEGFKEEIWAWGFRNPWRFSEDRITGRIWVGDVGQNAWEEIDLLERGGNYGWRCYEGPAPYDTSGCGPVAGYLFPVKAYPNGGPDCAVTGGYVYRGWRRPDLVGRYIYGDYCSGKIWTFNYTDRSQTIRCSLIRRS
jgi:glucose/arabinose dehydrogenase